MIQDVKIDFSLFKDVFISIDAFLSETFMQLDLCN